MRKPISSKHLESISDLTLTATIKPGFIDAFESITYETRLKMVLKALFKIRQTAREHSLIQPFVDTSARIRSLLDFRIAVLDTKPRRLLLSATFDRPFEPYMRLIWDPLGPLLDVIFCNCEGYVTATEHGFPEYLDWVRSAQIDTNFFYAAGASSIDDAQYARQIERAHREGQKDDKIRKIKVDDLVRAAADVRTGHKALSDQMGIEALVALYRLTDFYPPDNPSGDGKYLRWAAQHLLADWDPSQLGGFENAIPEQLRWFGEDRLPPREPCTRTRLTFDDSLIQGGILSNHGQVAASPEGAPPPMSNVSHGALLLMAITDPALARKFVGDLLAPGGLTIRRESDPPSSSGTYLNLAFTQRGLENIGVAAHELARFPQEFREGMEERAGLLGDVRASHPRRWTLPTRNWPPTHAAEMADVPVELSEVDIVLQLRTVHGGYQVGDTTHPLHAIIERLAGDGLRTGMRLLSVEPMSRANLAEPRDHFGLTDGISQPKPVDRPPAAGTDEVPRGDVFLGYANSLTDCPGAESAILDNGTFLVVRKLRQHVQRFKDFVKQEAARLEMPEEDFTGKLVGRKPDGTPLLPGPANPGDNNFTYANDAEGEHCPFQAHIRRTNPRSPAQDANGRPSPRILRRGMSYRRPGPTGTEDESGVFFMAYCASIAEQYEVIQRWVNGGNSTGVASWQSDPIMGVAEVGDSRTFAFRNARGKYERVKIPQPFVELQWGAYLFVPSIAAIRAIAGRRETDAELRKAADAATALRGVSIIDRLQRLAAQGDAGRIAAAAEWKACLEDFSAKDPGEKDEASAIWAAIRHFHDGALKVPYGVSQKGEVPADSVLVASKALVMRVFRNADAQYSMRGQMERMRRSFGEIFLGLDKGAAYDKVATPINQGVFKISEQEAFEVAYAAGSQWLSGVFDFFATIAKHQPRIPPADRTQAWPEALDLNPHGPAKIKLDLRRDYVTAVLAVVCNHWFGIPDGFPLRATPGKAHDLAEPAYTATDEPGNVFAGGWDWRPPGPQGRKPRCPGDYMATSRYCFYPDPLPRVQAYGQAQGQALRAAVTKHFADLRAQGKLPTAKIALVIATALQNDDDEAARTLIGVMTGFLPPTDGCLRWALYEWLEEKTFWRVQDAFIALDRELPRYDRANSAMRAPLERAMQKRPSPDMLWRTATADHRLGRVEVHADERVIIGIVSALAEDSALGITDTYPIFGGEHGASDSPTHACPAYKFAMGTMLGTLAALFDAGRIKALPAPLLVELLRPRI